MQGLMGAFRSGWKTKKVTSRLLFYLLVIFPSISQPTTRLSKVVNSLTSFSASEYDVLLEHIFSNQCVIFVIFSFGPIDILTQLLTNKIEQCCCAYFHPSQTDIINIFFTCLGSLNKRH